MLTAVLGTGLAGRTLASRLAGGGHEVVMGTRNIASSMARPEMASWLAGQPHVELAPFAEATRAADMVVNVTSGAASLEVLGSAGPDALAGKVLIDAANPLHSRPDGPAVLDPVSSDSLAEQVQRAFPQARVVKALNMMSCKIMIDPDRIPGQHTAFICGNDAAAKQAVTALLISFGWPANAVLDLGDITAARGMEMLWPLWLRVAQTLGHSDFNFHITST
ncbi:MAG TPA: NAD(P)-binding domain-containing protein [Streptosporangiaceae bacterium]|nr:NAD(P)-binding domain-containing protein [Streptosporangiaceae bacterium]